MNLKKILSNGIVSSLVMIALGIVLMLWPGDVMSVVCAVIGWGLLIAGVAGLVVLFVRKKKGKSGQATDVVSILKSVVSIILGIVLISKMETVVSILPFLIGIVVIINGAINAVQAVLYRKENKSWIAALVAGIVVLIMGLVMVLYPFGVAVSQIFLMGLSLELDGVSNLIYALTVKK